MCGYADVQMVDDRYADPVDRKFAIDPDAP